MERGGMTTSLLQVDVLFTMNVETISSLNNGTIIDGTRAASFQFRLPGAVRQQSLRYPLVA